MPEQLADGFDGHPLRQGDGRSERMARRMECNAPSDVRTVDDTLQAGIAPSVARQLEKTFVVRMLTVT